MRKWMAIVGLAIGAMVLSASPVLASCSYWTYSDGKRTHQCYQCCYNGNCYGGCS